MTLIEVFMHQGIVGLVCPLLFVGLIVAGVVVGLLKGKAVGYRFIAGAWCFAGLFTANVSWWLVRAAQAKPSAGGTMLCAQSLSALFFFLAPACGLTATAIAALALTKFDRRHIACEIMAVVAMVLLSFGQRWGIQGVFEMFTK